MDVCLTYTRIWRLVSGAGQMVKIALNTQYTHLNSQSYIGYDPPMRLTQAGHASCRACMGHWRNILALFSNFSGKFVQVFVPYFEDILPQLVYLMLEAQSCKIGDVDFIKILNRQVLSQ